jgi:arylsulfatase A-like enzyme
MDVVWLVLDSLPFKQTPFDPTGPDTMPQLAALAEETGIVYTNAYAPGPSSPSSHGSFFTGEPPSVTEMHEAFPYFESDIPTIAEYLNGHRSLLISANPYIFNGLDRGFDETNDLRTEEYLIFPDAQDPDEFPAEEYDSRLRKYLAYLAASSNPLRSVVNGIQYERIMRKRRSSLPETSLRDDQQFQYANEMNARIKTFLRDNDADTFVVANYMDIHPPLDASDEAIERFRGKFSSAELPIGVRGQDIYQRFRKGDQNAAERMNALKRATTWDTDRKVAPLINSLLKRDALVVVTADHGSWFRRETELDEERIHVPLVIFAPDVAPQRVDRTVNLQSLPRTTLSLVSYANADDVRGRDLLSGTDDEISVTEFIHVANEEGRPINPGGSDSDKICFDAAALRGNDRLDYIGDTYHCRRGDDDDGVLRETIEKRLSNAPVIGEHDIEYDDTVKQRLEDFGYL